MEESIKKVTDIL